MKIDYSMEEAIEKLNEYMQILENADTKIADAFSTYNDAMKLIEYCNKKLNKMEKDVEIIQNSIKIKEDE